jgi:uncharacterized membrane protein
MFRKNIGLALIVLSLLASCKHDVPQPGGNNGGGNGGGGSTTCSPDTAYFAQQVLPIITGSCATTGCHDAITQASGVRLTDYNTIMTTGEVVAGNPLASELYEKIVETDLRKRMPPPPRAALSAAQIATIKKWIEQGAKNNSCTAACDSSNVKYSTIVSSIMSTNCTGCHGGSSPSGGINLTNYAGVNTISRNGKLMNSILRNGLASPMPKNLPKLSDCDIKRIQKWVNEGSPNN